MDPSQNIYFYQKQPYKISSSLQARQLRIRLVYI